MLEVFVMEPQQLEAELEAVGEPQEAANTLNPGEGQLGCGSTASLVTRGVTQTGMEQGATWALAIIADALCTALLPSPSCLKQRCISFA